MCDDSFTDTSASVICKEMGFACSVYWNSGVRTLNLTFNFTFTSTSTSTLAFFTCMSIVETKLATIQEETEVQTSMNMSIMLDNVKCVDDALNFLNCSFSSGGHNCNHREDVHLVCCK